ncbi:hypothetical protein RM863_35180 [Streptomyces sp. DSM 41014]|uniref:Uncharacterized protein n=1 Tax=Streptomyces hintoniae TaxID=3075521 RepID=A0ABU2UVR0_9ACTN|nr:hypothetical protein [Streptomyces sp. DSM 41014]MDT0477378.1 hypothetical protein [Streptomyces sp. DSM 41014]
MTGTTTLSLGGLLAALLILYANLRPWWTSNRELKKLAPFGKGFSAAACAACCPSGLLGWLHHRSGTVANSAGERVGESTTGIAQGQGLTGGQLTGLGITGATVVVIAVYAAVTAWKAAGKDDKKRIIGGAFVGSVLCLTAGVAGLLSWLPAALNAAGAAVADAFQGANLL